MKKRIKEKRQLTNSFLVAAEEGDYEGILYGLRHSVNIHAEHEGIKDYALWIAVDMGNYDVTKLLIRHGANVHTNNDEPLASSAEHGYTRIVKLLIQNGASVNNINPEVFSISIERAQQKKQFEIVDMLNAKRLFYKI